MPGAGLSEGSEAGCEPCGASRYWTIALQPHPEGLGCDAGTGDGVARRCEVLGEADRGGEDRWRWRGIRIEMVVAGIVSAGLVGVYVGGGDHWVSLKGMSATSIVIFSSCLRPEPLRIDRFHDERLQNQSLSSISFCETASFWSTVKDLHQFLHSKLNLSGVHLSQGHSNGWHLGMWNKQLGFTIHRWAFGDSSQKCGCNGVGDGS